MGELAVPKCPNCGRPMRIRMGRFGKFVSCSGFPECDTSVSLDYQGKLMGVPADPETRALRQRAHRYFDKLWKSGLMCRETAYSNLKRWLHLTTDEAHIGMFDKTYCMALINKLHQMGLEEPK